MTIEPLPEDFFWMQAIDQEWLSNWKWELHNTSSGYYWRIISKQGSAIYFSPVFRTQKELENWYVDMLNAIPWRSEVERHISQKTNPVT